MPRRLRILVAANAALLLLIVVSSAWVVRPGQFGFLEVLWVVFGLVVGQVNLLAFWLGMGTSPFGKRMLGTGIVAVSWAALLAWWQSMQPNPDPPLLAFLGLLLALLVMLWLFAAAFFVVRRWVARLDWLEHPATKMQGARYQFTIFQVLLLTTAFAVVLGLNRGLLVARDGAHAHRALEPILVMVVMMLINLLASTWACLGAGQLRLRVTLVLVTATSLSGLVALSSGLFTFDWLSGLAATLMVLVPTVTVIVGLLVVRSCGYRLVSLRARS